MPVKSIVDVANYLENYKDDYIRKFQIDENKNKNLSYKEKEWEYGNGNARIKYTIEYYNGKIITETDYNWFIGNIGSLRIIKCITIDLLVHYYKDIKGSNNAQSNRINIDLFFKDNVLNTKNSDVKIYVETNNQESEAHKLYSEIMNILEDNEERFNNTLKHRKIRMQCFTVSIGIILSYILFVLLKINHYKLSFITTDYLNNKYILIFGQWFIALLLGNLLSYWYILLLYKPLLPETKYAGYNSRKRRSDYKDDMDDYLSHSEVHFGKFWDAEKRRNKIEKIYRITKKVVLIQLVLSIIFLLILK